jgi:DNA-binding CsgD family transcriptional regulator
MPPRLNLPPVMAAKLLASLRQGHTAPLAAQADGLQFLALPSVAPGPRAIVYMQSAHSFAAPAALLAEFTGLTLAEARFVAQLAQGKTIAQAGQDLNLTTETARYYSKQAYAKLAAPSQTALMRQIESSILRLISPAPPHNPNVKVP